MVVHFLRLFFFIFHRFVALRVFCWSLGPRLGSDSEGCRHLEFYESCLPVLFAPKFYYFPPIRRLESVLLEPGAKTFGSEGCRHLPVEFYENCPLFAPNFCYFPPIHRHESVLLEPGAKTWKWFRGVPTHRGEKNSKQLRCFEFVSSLLGPSALGSPSVTSVQRGADT